MMDAVEFLLTAKKICDWHRHMEWKYCYCKDCPFAERKMCFCQDGTSEEELKTAVEVVEDWVKEHPPKSNAQKFREVFGDAPTTSLDLMDKMGIFIPGEWWANKYKEPKK